MRFPAFLLGGLLLGPALPVLAQTAAEAPATPRFYVGLGAYSSYYNGIGHYSQYSNGDFRLPVQLTAGYQLRPRLAVQVGLTYSGGTSHYAENTLYLNANTGPNSSYYTLDGDYTRRQASVSALARYTLTANPAHRLQFDALGGFTLERASSHSRGTQTNYASGSTATTSDYSFNHAQNTLLLTGGVGARYRLSRRFELTYDFTVNKALTGPAPHPAPAGLTSSQALGLRYRFGR